MERGRARKFSGDPFLQTGGINPKRHHVSKDLVDKTDAERDASFSRARALAFHDDGCVT